MADYIEREAIKYEQWAFGPYNGPLKIVRKTTIDSIPTANVAPVSELLDLRDVLYENDQITMRGLARLNRLIAKYGGYDHD